ncbi:fibronectin type III domain-containing protein [Flammeovirga kamogawensis]|uniref:Fibronectin type III domain-containing protein n=1 Tax=Flammeovirga kamogawensis TaxID=373891 RepID=A0ABX8H374_9BACT|nr:fibronectin type III domain-containing protein [Flammeovirga kamogawensis]MBB6460469.1 chitodextrinase [Flammeovirga kamogawensis]QWG10275.1 fibronectin type III domain-containing protein [Flammeovirga kamogawensis]TRX64723.1 T9SS type A sorting domain-containing protein [Flammeovirga kamogawensis]
MNNKSILLYLFLVVSQFSYAKDIYVSADGDNSHGGTSLALDAVADLYTAFTLASNGDVIIVDGTAGVIAHPTEFAMNKYLTVRGQNNAIIDADGNRKIFNYTPKDVDAYLTVENISFINGNGYYDTDYQRGGGFFVNTTGTLTLKDCVFEGHSTTKHGGVFSIQQGNVLFESCVFNNNNLAGNFNGGVIYSETDLAVDITITECLFTENTVQGNGGVVSLLFKDHATDTYLKNFKVTNSTFYNNSSLKSGGVVNDISTGEGTIEFENVTISGNKTDGNAGNSGGLMLNSATSTYLIENSIIYGNKTFSNGEAISDLSMNDAAKITIKSTIFGAIVKNDITFLEDDSNANTSLDEQTVYGSIATATNENIPTLTLTYDAANGVFSFASDALPINFADATLLTGSDDHSFLSDQLGNVRREVNNAIDAGAYQLDGEATVEEVLADVIAPTDPSNLVFSNIETTSFDVAWDAATDDIMFSHYEVQLNDATPITTTELTISFSGLTISTSYTVKIKAIDYNGNESNVVTVDQVTANKVIYVKAGDDTGNDGLSADAPYATLLKAYNNAIDGDTIEIDGTIVYDTSIGITKNLTIRGVNTATLDAQNTLKFFNFTKSETDSYLEIENISFINGNGEYNGSTAQMGGAILMNSPGKVTITECIFDSNTSEKNGGVLAIQDGEVEINASLFKNNSAGGVSISGGVIHLLSTTNDVVLKVNQTAFLNNTSATHGGVLNVQTNSANGFRFDASFTNSTFYENQTSSAGGVIFLGNTGDGTLSLTNVTMVNNRTLANEGNCGGIRSINEDAVVTINNSIVYNNLANYNDADGSGSISDISTNDYPNFTINHSIVSAIVASNTINGSNTLNGTVNGSDAPELTLNAINADNVVTFDSDAIAANHGLASYLSAYPTHETYLVDQLDNVRIVEDDKIDCGAYQVDATSNIALVLEDNQAPTDVATITFDEVTYNSIDVSWTASTDNIEVTSYKIQLDGGSQIEVFETNYKFESLAAETAYEVSVTAVDIAGNTSNVVSETTTTLEEPATPIVPTNVLVKEVSQTEAIVTWDDPADDGLSFEVRIDGTTYETSEFSYVLEGLTAATDYDVFVLSKNYVGDKSSENSTSFSTLSVTDTVTIYINTAGDDTNSGLNSVNAVATLKKAVELTSDNDKIIIDGTITHTEAVTINESLEIIGQNDAVLDGGDAIKFISYLDKTDGSYLTLENISFKNGNGTTDGATAQLGGAMLINTVGTLTIDNCIFENNKTAKGGGALAVQSGTVNIMSSSFIGNETTSGTNGGVFLVNSNGGDCDINIYQSLMKDNVSDNHGGVMIIEGSNNSSNVFIQNSTLYNNGTTNAGGAIFGTGSTVSNLTFENSTITNNYTLNTIGNGGGIRVVNLSLDVLINNTILYENESNYGTVNELMSDLSLKLNVIGVVNSSIVGTVVESVNNAMFTDDGITQNGTVSGAVASDVPSLSLLAIDENGVVGFANDALPVAFANVDLYTKEEGSGNVLDQLNNLRTANSGKIDCGAYQLDGTALVDDSGSNLPVELIRFDANVMDRIVQLTWVTASEVNNDYFEIQSSIDRQQWTTIGTQNGAGNSDVTNTYNFKDDNATLNVESYYRLIQYDFDGDYSITTPIRVLVKSDDIFYRAYPNPAQNKVNVISSNTIKRIRILDRLGREVLQKNVDEKTITLDISKLNKGIYILNIEHANGKYSQLKLVRD